MLKEKYSIVIVNVYGSIGLTNPGYHDKEKFGIIKKLDVHGGVHVHTFLEDIVCAISEAAASRMAHRLRDIEDGRDQSFTKK